MTARVGVTAIFWPAAILEAETTGIPSAPDPSKKIKHAPKEENRRVKIDAYAAAALRLLLIFNSTNIQAIERA